MAKINNDGVDDAKTALDKSGSQATVRGRVLRECAYGQPDDVVDVDADQVESLVGVVDTDPAAVAYAESLKKD
jgi:hypothetical protein